MTTRLAIVDDHELFAQSLAIALRAHGFRVSVHAPDDVSRVLGDLLRDPPDVVLLDLQLGDQKHGLSLVQPLTAAGSRVLVVTGVTDRCELAATLEAGAVGYVAKSKPVELLLETATAVARGRQVTSDGARHELLAELRAWRVQDRAAHTPYLQLTPRERSVLHALAAGDASRHRRTRRGHGATGAPRCARSCASSESARSWRPSPWRTAADGSSATARSTGSPEAHRVRGPIRAHVRSERQRGRRSTSAAYPGPPAPASTPTEGSP